MSVEELEKAVTKLSSADRARLLRFLAEMDAVEFDAKIERDALSGKLNRFAEEAREDMKAGHYREL